MASWTDMNRRSVAAALVAASLGNPAGRRGDDQPSRFLDDDHHHRSSSPPRRSPSGCPSKVVRSRRSVAAIRTDGGCSIFGVIHGDEQAGLQIVALLTELPVPPGVDLYLVESMNPDGVANNTRGNANGVDLNRNFPYNWGPIGAPGDGQYAGPAAASEPETQAAVELITALRPDLVVWYHQDLFTIAPGQGRDGAIRARYAELTGLPMETITGGTYTGVAAQWARDELASNATAARRGVHRRARSDAVGRRGPGSRRGGADDRRREQLTAKSPRHLLARLHHHPRP